MIGRSHAITGAAAGTAAACLGVATDAPTLAACIALGAGSALVPDIDHAGTTVSKSLGPATQALSKAIGTISGGHRKGTHSFIGFAAFAALGYAAGIPAIETPASHAFGQTIAAGTIRPAAIALAAWLAVLAGTALGIRGTGGRAATFAAGAVLSITAGIDGIWLAAAMGAGSLVHAVAGDMLTVEGVPLLWPLNRQFRLPVLGKTGSARENLYVSIVAFAACTALAIRAVSTVLP